MCGQAGHISKDCPNSQGEYSEWKKFQDQEAEWGSGGRGEGPMETVEQRPGEWDQSVEWRNTRVADENHRRGVEELKTCFECGGKDHLARDCPNV